MQRLSIYNDSIAASKHQRHTIYTDDEVTMLYLQLLATTMPHYHHLYNAVQVYSKYELEIEELEEINVHVSYIQRKLFRLELTEDNHIHNDKTNIAYRPRHSSNKQPSSSRPFSNNPRRHRHQANFALQSEKFNQRSITVE
jgi:hypothetical protein